VVRQILIICGFLLLVGALSVFYKLRFVRALSRKAQNSSTLADPRLNRRRRGALFVRLLVEAVILVVVLIWYLHRR